MKTITIDKTGEKFEVIRQDYLPCGDQFVIQCAPIPPKQKTIVQVAAEAAKCNEKEYRHEYYVSTAFMDAIEQRLQAIEKKLEAIATWSDAGGKVLK